MTVREVEAGLVEARGATKSEGEISLTCGQMEEPLGPLKGLAPWPQDSQS